MKETKAMMRRKRKEGRVLKQTTGREFGKVKGKDGMRIKSEVYKGGVR